MSQVPSSSLQTGPVGTSAAPTNQRVGFVCSHSAPGAGGVREQQAASASLRNKRKLSWSDLPVRCPLQARVF